MDFYVSSAPHALLTQEYFNLIYPEQIRWDKKLVDVEGAWAKTTGLKPDGSKVRVGVIDTGIDFTHPDLKNQVVDGFNFTTSAPTDYIDRAGHGTHCAGLIGAEDNPFGVVGVNPKAELFAVKALGDNGFGSNDWITRGIKVCVDSGCDVISMSLGGAYPYEPMKKAIDRAIAAGVIVVCAAGNDEDGNPKTDNVDYPARWNKGITVVAAVDRFKAHAYFSSTGKSVVIAAPGVDVYSTYPNNRYCVMSGTSMATPIIAGFASLAKAKDPGIDAFKFNEMLVETAEDLGKPGRDTEFGAGLVRGDKLLGVVGTRAFVG